MNKPNPTSHQTPESDVTSMPLDSGATYASLYKLASVAIEGIFEAMNKPNGVVDKRGISLCPWCGHDLADLRTHDFGGLTARCMK